MDKRTWSKKDTYRLIENLELYPELWDAKCEHYRNRIKKQHSMGKLAELFNTSTMEIQRKIHNLRTQLNQEFRKIQKRNEHGTDESYNKSSTWEFFEVMKFIRPSNISFSSDDKSHLFLINDIEDQQSHSDTGLMEEFPVQNLKREFTKSNCAETETKDAVVAIKTPDSKYREDCQIFGDFVASELQSLSEPTRKKLKRRILRAILDVSSLEDLSPISTSPVLYDSSPHS